MAYKVAQEQLRKFLEEVEKKMRAKQFEMLYKFRCSPADVVEMLTVPFPGSC
jgi:hypothetical protein